MKRSQKSLEILLRARMTPRDHRLPQPPTIASSPLPASPPGSSPSPNPVRSAKMVEHVRGRMRTSISIPSDGQRRGGGAEALDTSLEEFSQGYQTLHYEDRHELLHFLAKEYDVNRLQVRELMNQYLSFKLPHSTASELQPSAEDESAVSAFYRMERSLRNALKPMYAEFFERLNAHPGGLKLLALLRADLLALLVEENVPSLRALDWYLKEKLVTWLSPAVLVLHQITWDDPASLLEKIVAYEAVHPIRNLVDLKRRLGVGRRCFGYFHPGMPGEPLIFIEVAFLKEIASSIQEVLWDDPPAPECEAKCALFYSISSSQAGLSGINLGKFLLKRVIEMLRKEKPSVEVFATLSPVPGFMQWLLTKLACQIKLEEEVQEGNMLEEGPASTFREPILLPEEEKILCDSVQPTEEFSGIKVMLDILTSSDWAKSDKLIVTLRPPLMRLCTRYLIEEKKRGKALDAVANFHLQNGAMVYRINWMADQSDKGIQQSGGIMVNYMYRLDNIEENARLYFYEGRIHASPCLCD